MVYDQWFKFMCNVGINQCSGAFKLPYAPFQHKKNGIKEARDLMEMARNKLINCEKCHACQNVALHKNERPSSTGVLALSTDWHSRGVLGPSVHTRPFRLASVHCSIVR